MKRREVAVLQHVPNEPGGVIEKLIIERGISLRQVALFDTNEIPALPSTHLIVMGGPMSVNDEEEYPFLHREKELIREWVGRGKPVLGICLGAQLIASAGGAPVYPCEPELGWYRVRQEKDLMKGLPKRFGVFQMHGETFVLPHGAELVCSGDGVVHQALAWGSALGLQFHLELTMEMIKDWISDRPSEEQSHILEMSTNCLPESQRLCRCITDIFLSAPDSNFTWL